MTLLGMPHCDASIVTSQWVMTLLGMPHCDASIVTSQWVMTLLGMPHCDASIVTSQWLTTLPCVHIMASQWIMMMRLAAFAMYYYTKL